MSRRGSLTARGAERFTGRSVAAAWLNPPDDRCRRRDPVQVGICDFGAEEVRGSVCRIVSGCVGEGKKRLVPAGSERDPCGVTAFSRRAGRSGGGRGRTGSVARVEERAVRRFSSGKSSAGTIGIPAPGCGMSGACRHRARVCGGVRGRRGRTGRGASGGRGDGCGVFGDGSRLQERIGGASPYGSLRSLRQHCSLMALLDLVLLILSPLPGHTRVRAEGPDPRSAQRGSSGSPANGSPVGGIPGMSPHVCPAGRRDVPVTRSAAFRGPSGIRALRGSSMETARPGRRIPAFAGCRYVSVDTTGLMVWNGSSARRSPYAEADHGPAVARRTAAHHTLRCGVCTAVVFAGRLAQSMWRFVRRLLTQGLAATGRASGTAAAGAQASGTRQCAVPPSE